MNDDVVIRPVRPGNWPDPPSLAFMIGNGSDMSALVSRSGISRKRSHTFLNSRLYYDPDGPFPACIAGPFIGAPYAVILMETLIAWGVKGVIFFGWCGSLNPEVRIGDILIPSAAYIADGTTPYYFPHPASDSAIPSANLNAGIAAQFQEKGRPFHQGPIWTTDAVFRETPALLEKYQNKGALAVEMEGSALFAVGGYRGVAVSAVLAVSDELHSLKWKPGFGDHRFRSARKTVIELFSSMNGRLQDLIL